MDATVSPIKKEFVQPVQTTLTPTEKQKVRKLLAEIQARNIDIPDEIKDEILGVRKNFPWPNEFVKPDGRIFNPTPFQKGFLESNALFDAIIGGRGSGKTATASQMVLKKLKDGLPGAVMNPDFENFKISTWPELRDWIPWDHVIPKHRHRRNQEWFPQQPFIHVFDTGGQAICKGLKEPDSARGPNINWLWYDEFGRDETGEAFRIAVPSVRVGKDPQIILTGTPNGSDHWGSKLLIDQEFPAEMADALKELGGNRKIVDVFFGSTYENKVNLDPATYAMVLAMYAPGTWLYKQEILGQVVSHGGVLGNREWFNGKIIPRPPDSVNMRLRYWDLSATEKKMVKRSMLDPDETVGTLLSYQKNVAEKTMDFFIEDQHCGYWEWDELLEQIYQTALRDGPSVKQYFEQEPASGGKNQVAAIVKHLTEKLPGWITPEGHNPRDYGDKVMRANIWFAEASAGHFYLVYGDWNEPFLKQLGDFPISRHDDKVDSVSGARVKVAPVFAWRTVPFLRL